MPVKDVRSCRAEQHVARFAQPGIQLMQSYCLCTCADFLESMDPSVRIKLRSMFDDGLVGRCDSQQLSWTSSMHGQHSTAAQAWQQ
jgi:hypothetical protein